MKEAREQGKPDHELSLESMDHEELTLEKYSIAMPLMCYPEQSLEGEVGKPEWKLLRQTSTSEKRFISLLVTIENSTPLVDLSQCLGTRALSELLEFPWEEGKNIQKTSKGDQSLSDNSYVVLQPQIDSSEKRHKCGDCGKLFNHRTNLRTHKRIHTGEKPYTCVECGTSFRQHSHLTRHMNTHVKKKPYTCQVCRKSFMCLPVLEQHQKTHFRKGL
ncbi:zinc finger protein 597 [Rhynchocyon petersi]